MTPKEKANELFDKYDKIDFHDCSDHKQSAKECAIIAVDEKIELLQYWIDNPTFTNDHCKPTGFGADVLTVFADEIYYLQQVKEELEKM